MKIRNHIAIIAHFKNKAGPIEDKTKNILDYKYQEYICSSCKEVLYVDEVKCPDCINKESL